MKIFLQSGCIFPYIYVAISRGSYLPPKDKARRAASFTLVAALFLFLEFSICALLEFSFHGVVAQFG